MIAYFNTLKLDVSDARTLFRLLDRSSAERTPRGLEAGGVADGGEVVEVEEVVETCDVLVTVCYSSEDARCVRLRPVAGRL